MKISTAVIAVAMATIATSSSADVIIGPVLDVQDAGYSVTGLGFEAETNSILTGFTLQNQGQADTVVLADSSGNILDSVSTPADVFSYAATVSWALTAGKTYWLLQTTPNNEWYTRYHGPLLADDEIQIVQTGTFSQSILGAVTNDGGWGVKEYWAAFNNLITEPVLGSPVPEPATWTLMLAGFGGLGFALRRRGAVGVA